MSLLSISIVLIVGLGAGMVSFCVVAISRDLLACEYVKSFECGFTSMNVSKMRVSIRFYHILVVFLLMDVEVVMLFFLPNVIPLGIFDTLWLVEVLISVYFVGLMYELTVGGLSWSN